MTTESGTAQEPVSTERFLFRLGHRYAAVGRTAVAVGSALLALFSSTPGGTAVLASTVAVTITWSGTYLWSMLRGAKPWVWITDVALIAALCLAQPWLVPAEHSTAQIGWVLSIAAFTVVAVQWHLGAFAASMVTLVLACSYVVGAAAAVEVGWSQVVPMGAWMVVEAALSRLLWVLVRRGGRVADGLMVEHFELTRQTDVAAARRAAQRAHWATVHDTSATTLLMLGFGETTGHERWLGPQIQRDLAAMRGAITGSEVQLDLVGGLTRAAAESRVDVALDLPRLLTVPGPVASAFTGAVSEALENVRRHSGVDDATLDLRTNDGRIVVTVVDRGQGFDTRRVPTGRRGLAWSIDERMSAAGGRARCESRARSGTVVRLEWPVG